ncbi:Peptidase family M23 [Jatrophihabitans endophyticus]|uniref:Peptidase family M23 n=1 Tax=Jatrophihabitans endophyticus TaxID=1206085 RepID=A0A1M5DBV9_9ACTN|nr:peptidoglycan DD-metalloendopeptidase family protein [Jatrophihabitans endophyticus]SHF64420.1 Peptidase family M23 [Jatrophihabitans endophyticus]
MPTRAPIMSRRTRTTRIPWRGPLALLAAAPLAAAVFTAPSGVSSTAGARPAPRAATAVPAAPAAVLAAASAGTSAGHPYSDPVWYPLQVEAKIDCVRDNPGCPNGHKFWGIDMSPTGQEHKPSNAKVLAMGAGVMHIADAHGDKCTPTTKSSFGTEVWIDHGGGVISRYGHLSRIIGHAGDLVRAGQAIGVVGDTGKASNCGRNFYTDFNVKHHHYGGDGAQLKRLKTCGTSGAVTYPNAVTRYSIFNDVPKRTVLPAPAGGTRCYPTTAPATPRKAGGVTLKRSGSQQLTVRWKAPARSQRVTSVLVELSTYHPTKHRYDVPWNHKFVSLRPGTTAQKFGKLIKNRNYRARVSFHNAAGWSRYGTWVVAKTR